MYLLSSPPQLTCSSGTSKSGGAPSQVAATFITNLLTTSALTNHIHATLLAAYSARYQILYTAIQEHLVPHGCTLPGLPASRDVVGGFFIWIELPAELSAVDVARHSEKSGVIIAEGSLFAVWGDAMTGDDGMEEIDRKTLTTLKRTLDQGIRLCFAWVTVNEMREGVAMLGTVVAKLLREKRANGYDDRRRRISQDGERVNAWA